MKPVLRLISKVLSASILFALTVAAVDAPTGAITIQIPSNLSGTLGQEFTAVFQAGGGQAPYTWRITSGTLPPGLTLKPVLTVPDCTPAPSPAKPNCGPPYNDPTRIKITGAPTQPGRFPMSMTATDSKRQVGDVSFTLIVVKSADR